MSGRLQQILLNNFFSLLQYFVMTIIRGNMTPDSLLKTWKVKVSCKEIYLTSAQTGVKRHLIFSGHWPTIAHLLLKLSFVFKYYVVIFKTN